MRTFSLLKGLSVYDQSNGGKIGEICDLSITSSGLVNGLLIKNGAIVQHLFFLPIERIYSFGTDGIMVSSPTNLEKIKSESNFTLSHQHSLYGKMLISKCGDSMGLLEDVYFLESKGTIVGYEVTDGFFTDISEGKKVIKTKNPPMIGKDAIIVDVIDA